MSTKAEATEEIIISLDSGDPDFSEVEWQVVSADVSAMIRDNYEALPAVQKLLEGSAIRIPSKTKLSRLYRFFTKKGYVLHRRKIDDNNLVLWAERKTTTE